jgi:hypothetical protein
LQIDVQRRLTLLHLHTIQYILQLHLMSSFGHCCPDRFSKLSYFFSRLSNWICKFLLCSGMLVSQMPTWYTVLFMWYRSAFWVGGCLSTAWRFWENNVIGVQCTLLKLLVLSYTMAASSVIFWTVLEYKSTCSKGCVTRWPPRDMHIWHCYSNVCFSFPLHKLPRSLHLS